MLIVVAPIRVRHKNVPISAFNMFSLFCFIHGVIKEIIAMAVSSTIGDYLWVHGYNKEYSREYAIRL